MRQNHLLFICRPELDYSSVCACLGSDYSASAVFGCEEALTYIRCSSIDLILLDLMLPKESIAAFLHALSSQPETAILPVVAMVPRDCGPSCLPAELSGVSDYIAYPFAAWLAAHRLKQVLQHSQQNLSAQHSQQSDYQHKLGSLYQANPSILSAALLNLTQDTCREHFNRINPKDNFVCGKVDDFIRQIADRIPDQETGSQFLNTFCTKHLKRSYEEGNPGLSLIYIVTFDGRRHQICTHAEVLRNPSTGDLEAILYATDITGSYVEKTVSHHILSKSFDLLGILDLPQDRISTFTLSADDTTPQLSSDVSIDSFCRQYCEYHIAAENRESFLKNASLPTIQSQLARKDSYVFHARTLDVKGKRRFMQYHFSYLRKDLGIVLMVVKDVTNEMGQDDLTGDLNRRGFLEYVDMLLHSGQEYRQYAILYLDLLDFKAINELIGTAGGDEILRKVSATIRESFLDPAAVAHISGSDHFLCLVRRENLDLSRMSEVLHHSWVYDGHPIDIFSQCGIFLIEDTSLTSSGMCDCAKLAMKQIVDSYVQPYAFYTQDLREEYIARASVIAELKHALVNHEFQVYYQPIYDAKTRRIVSAEALIRWNSPKKGLVSPGVFIPILEENGRISKLDLFVAQSVEQLLDRRILENRPVVPVSVNLSGMDFHDQATIDTLLETSNRLGRDSNLRFEITETAYVSMSEENSEVTRKLRKAGTKLLIDDFGSGYSSFSIIMDYDFDILKLDIGFIRKIGINSKSEKIIRAIIDMAHNIDVKVIAEGAETKEQVDFLIASNCDFIQGFYFSRPLPQESFEQLLDREGFSHA